MPARTAIRTSTAATHPARRTPGGERAGMTRPRFATALLAVAVAAGAQQVVQDVSLALGVQQTYFDTDSSKYLEYRDLPQGAVLPALRLQALKGDFRYDL